MKATFEVNAVIDGLNTPVTPVYDSATQTLFYDFKGRQWAAEEVYIPDADDTRKVGLFVLVAAGYIREGQTPTKVLGVLSVWEGVDTEVHLRVCTPEGFNFTHINVWEAGSEGVNVLGGMLLELVINPPQYQEWKESL